MARRATAEAHHIDQILRDAAEQVVSRVSPLIARVVGEMVSLRIKNDARSAPGGRARGRRRGEDMTRWVADRRARRVPKFVIEATGLDTKKKIVAKFGENAAFEKGKPLPRAKG
jgi:hypothetical protein